MEISLNLSIWIRPRSLQTENIFKYEIIKSITEMFNLNIYFSVQKKNNIKEMQNYRYFLKGRNHCKPEHGEVKRFSRLQLPFKDGEPFTFYMCAYLSILTRLPPNIWFLKIKILWCFKLMRFLFQPFCVFETN